jgi:hypothetical protein
MAIALDAGCANPSHFAQRFRWETGLAPGDYRRHRRTENQAKNANTFQRKNCDTKFTNWREFKYAESVTEISPVLTHSGYAGKSSHKVILPLLAERGEGRGEESSFTRENNLDMMPPSHMDSRS